MMNNQPTRVVIVAGGSFNPITNQHLRNFELARDCLHQTGLYKVVGGIISPVNDGYSKKDLISSKHRCAMVELALRSSDWIKLDTWESDQEGWLETVKVLDHLQSVLNSNCNKFAFNNNTHSAIPKKAKLDLDNLNSTHHNKAWDFTQPVRIKFLCGADLLESFSVPGLWKEEDISEMVGRFGLVVVTREGSNPMRFIYESDLLSKFQNNIHIATEWISNEISSTHIRRALRRGLSIKYLIPDPVINYCKDHGLYSEMENKYCSCFLTPSPNYEYQPMMGEEPDFYQPTKNLTAVHSNVNTPKLFVTPAVQNDIDSEQETAV